MASSANICLGEHEVVLAPKYVIGQGSFGKVYQGTNKRTNEKVAVKEIELSNDNEEDEMMIYRELTSMDTLRQHPNVIRMLDAKVSDSHCWIVMELCKGDLSSYLKKHKSKLTLGEKIDLMYQAVSPIEFMHSREPPIIHRDIKPGNFLYQVNPGGEGVILKVSDFGLAKLCDRESGTATIDLYSKSQSATLCGTMHYMAPEFWVGDTLRYDKTVDNFALGLMFLVLLLSDATSKDLPYSVQAKKDKLLYSYIGNEMQIAKKNRKPMPVVVEFDSTDSPIVKKIKTMIAHMIHFDPKKRTPLFEVEEVLKQTAGELKTNIHIALPQTMERELSNLTVEPEPDSGVATANQTTPSDSLGYSMLSSTPSMKTDGGADSGYGMSSESAQASVIEQLKNCLLTSGSSYGSVFKAGQGSGHLKCGDVVRVDSDKSRVKKAHSSTWTEDMAGALGLPGVVTGFEDRKARVKCINQKSYVFNTEVLHKEPLDRDTMSGGDYVMVKSDIDQVKAIQQRDGGGWVDAMEKQIGKPGIVRCIRKKNRVKVEHSGKHNYVWCKEALILVAKGQEIIGVLLSNKR